MTKFLASLAAILLNSTRSPGQHRKRAVTSGKPCLEILETRDLLARNLLWVGGTFGSWSEQNNWVDMNAAGVVHMTPTDEDHVFFDPNAIAACGVQGLDRNSLNDLAETQTFANVTIAGGYTSTITIKGSSVNMTVTSSFWMMNGKIVHDGAEEEPATGFVSLTSGCSGFWFGGFIDRLANAGTMNCVSSYLHSEPEVTASYYIQNNGTFNFIGDGWLMITSALGIDNNGEFYLHADGGVISSSSSSAPFNNYSTLLKTGAGATFVDLALFTSFEFRVLGGTAELWRGGFQFTSNAKTVLFGGDLKMKAGQTYGGVYSVYEGYFLGTKTFFGTLEIGVTAPPPLPGVPPPAPAILSAGNQLGETGSLSIVGELKFGSSNGTLVVDFGNANDYDTVFVSKFADGSGGTATAGKTLEVNFKAQATKPDAGSFTIITAAGGFGGQFATFVSPVWAGTGGNKRFKQTAVAGPPGSLALEVENAP